MEEYKEYTIKVTPEEFAEINSIIRKKREEQARKVAIETYNIILRQGVTHAIDAIGLEETKRLIRAISFDLRHASADNI